MKKIYVLILGFLIFFSLPSISKAGSNDVLVRILLKKGILTKEEARQVIEEMKKEEVKKRKQLKEVTSEDMKKDVKVNENRVFKNTAIPNTFKGIKFGMLSYIDFSTGKISLFKSNKTNYSKFSLTRGYLTLRKEFLPWLYARLTYDIHRDATGDYKSRIKYLYADLKPKSFGIFTGMNIEIGQGHTPWLDFEEHINPYRMQGTMPIERAGVLSSADLGVSIKGDFNGILRDAKRLIGNTSYIGKYGSWHIGIFNGAGYHNEEKNTNKVLEARITLRPMPNFIPGFQLSYFGVYGKGNKKIVNGDYPDFKVNLFMLSYEIPSIIFTAQYFNTKGNAKGTWVDTKGHTLRTAGYSFFVDYRIPIIFFFKKRFHIFYRYDHFNQDKSGYIADNGTFYNMYILGITYNICTGNKLIFDFEYTKYGHNAGIKGNLPKIGNNLDDNYKIQAVLQLKF